MTLFSVTCGPILGIFVLGLFIPFSNSNGAFYGGIISFLFSIYMFIGFYAFDNKIPKNIFNQTNCSFNVTQIKKKTPFPNSITYEWYGLIAVSIVLIFGCIISFLTSNYKNFITSAQKSFEFRKIC